MNINNRKEFSPPSREVILSLGDMGYWVGN